MKNSSRIRRLLFILMFSAVACVSIWAQDFSDDSADTYARVNEITDNPISEDTNSGTSSFPILMIPIGGLYESLGTAMTALPLDATSMIANPAVSSVLGMTELSFLHNDWIDDVNIESLIYTGRFNDLGYGAYATFAFLPFTEWNEWAERESTGYFSEMLMTLNISYNFLNSYYFDGFSVGANLRGAYRRLPSEIGENNPGNDKLTVMADFGILTQFNLAKFYVSRDKNFSIGAAVKNLGVPVLYDHNENAINSPEPLPSEVSVGIGYSPFRPLKISVDFNYPFSILPDVEPMKWNFAAGINLTVTEFLAFQSGFRYDGQNPRLSLGSKVDLDWINFLINYTLDLTTQFSTPFDRLSIQAQVDLGDDGRAQLQKQVDELYIAGLDSYATGDILKAIRYWRAAVVLDPTFQPAAEYLSIAEYNIELQKQLEDLTRVE